MTVVVAILAAVLAADAPLPEGNAYVREDLDGKGGVTRRRTQTYETFFGGGRPVRRLVSEDGRPLDGKQRAPLCVLCAPFVSVFLFPFSVSLCLCG